MLVGTDAPVSAARCVAPRRGSRPAFSRRGRHRRARSRRRCAEGGSTRTTWRPVEWLIDTSIVQVAARGER
jgi:hypothetical protein